MRRRNIHINIVNRIQVRNWLRDGLRNRRNGVGMESRRGVRQSGRISPLVLVVITCDGNIMHGSLDGIVLNRNGDQVSAERICGIGWDERDVGGSVVGRPVTQVRVNVVGGDCGGLLRARIVGDCMLGDMRHLENNS